MTEDRTVWQEIGDKIKAQIGGEWALERELEIICNERKSERG